MSKVNCMKSSIFIAVIFILINKHDDGESIITQ